MNEREFLAARWLEFSMGLRSDTNSAVSTHGRSLVYVGEWRGGCTGDDAFHDYLDENFEIIEEVLSPRWGGINDTRMVFRRKANQ